MQPINDAFLFPPLSVALSHFHIHVSGISVAFQWVATSIGLSGQVMIEQSMTIVVELMNFFLMNN